MYATVGKAKALKPMENATPQARATTRQEESTGNSQDVATPSQLVQVGAGFPALPKKVVERILSNQYVEFAELPPAKRNSRQMTQALEGGPGGRPFTDQESNTRPGDLVPVLCTVCGSASPTPTGQDCEDEHEVQVASMDRVQP